MTPRIAFKSEVRMDARSLYPEVTTLLRCGLYTAPPLFENVMMVTSANDGKHSIDPLSGHYVGCAFDIRIFGHRAGGIEPIVNWDAEELEDLQTEIAIEWANAWNRSLASRDYLVIAEIGKSHIHAQYGRAPSG